MSMQELKHPNIVRMFDVIDTEKYIGIVLDFAGGRLGDHSSEKDSHPS